MKNILNWLLLHPTWLVYSLLSIGIYIYYLNRPFQAKTYIVQRRRFTSGFFIGTFNLEDRTIVDLIFFAIISIWLESPVKEYNLPISQIAMINLGIRIDYRIFNIFIIFIASIFWGVYGLITNERTRDLGVIISFIFMFNFSGRAILGENTFTSYVMVALVIIHWVLTRIIFKEDKNDKSWFSLLVGSVLAALIFNPNFFESLLK